jgi:hypothetical protein
MITSALEILPLLHSPCLLSSGETQHLDPFVLTKVLWVSEEGLAFQQH